MTAALDHAPRPSLTPRRWALTTAPIPPARRGGPSRHACSAVLVALAEWADLDDGRGAYPSVATLALCTLLSERQVRAALRELEGHGTIRRGNPMRTAHLPADRRPVVWDLAMELERPAEEQPCRGVQRPRPATRHGVQPTHQRGAGAAPNRPLTTKISPLPTPHTPRPAAGRPPAAAEEDPSTEAKNLLAALDYGAHRRPGARDLAELGALLDAGRAAGCDWTRLRAHAQATVRAAHRSAVGALRVYLRADNLPAVETHPTRKPWCGECDENTRWREVADGMARCRCHAAF